MLPQSAGSAGEEWERPRQRERQQHGLHEKRIGREGAGRHGDDEAERWQRVRERHPDLRATQDRQARVALGPVPRDLPALRRRRTKRTGRYVETPTVFVDYEWRRIGQPFEHWRQARDWPSYDFDNGQTRGLPVTLRKLYDACPWAHPSGEDHDEPPKEMRQ